MISGAILARVLGVEGRGLYAAVTLWPLLFISLGDLGAPLAFVYQSAGGRVDVRKLATNGLVLTIVQSVLLIGLLALVVPLVVGTEGNLAEQSFLFGVISIPAQTLGKYFNSILQGKGHVYRFNLYRNITSLLNTLGLIVLLSVGNDKLETALTMWLAGSVVFALFPVVSVLRLYWPFRGFDLDLAKNSLNYGLRGHLGNVAPIDSFKVDLIFVVALLSAEDAGLYTVAIAAANVLKTQAVTMGMISFPSIAAQKEHAGKVAVARRYSAITLSLVLAAAVFLLVFAGPLISLVYGREYLDATGPTRWLIVAMVFASLRQLIGDVLRAFGAPGISSIAEVSSWLVVFLLFPLLIPAYGLTGAAMCVICAYMTSLWVAVVLASRRGFSVAGLLGWTRTPVHTG